MARHLQTPVLNGLKWHCWFFIAERCLVFHSGCPEEKKLVLLSPTGAQYRKARKHNKTVISETFSWSLSPINPFIALLKKIIVTKDLMRRQMLIQCLEFLGFLAAKNLSSVLHLNLDLNNSGVLLQYILGEEAFRANLNWSSYSDFRADKQFLTPAEGTVYIGYLELQTEICRAVSASCKK